MTDPYWAPVEAALDRAAQADRMIDVWLRDDDAVSATPALGRLADLCEGHGLPILLAVIPDRADDTLRRFVETRPAITPTQHGFAHTNHAAPGARACELGGARSVAEVVDDLAQGRDRLCRLFGPSATNILVPPWNRIADSVLPHVPGLGFRAISTYGALDPTVPDLLALNCNIDIIDWRGGRVCHPHDKLVGKLLSHIEDAMMLGRPIGLLTHHLAHDEACWDFLEAALTRLAGHQAVRFTTADAILSRDVVARP